MSARRAARPDRPAGVPRATLGRVPPGDGDRRVPSRSARRPTSRRSTRRQPAGSLPGRFVFLVDPRDAHRSVRQAIYAEPAGGEEAWGRSSSCAPDPTRDRPAARPPGVGPRRRAAPGRRRLSRGVVGGVVLRGALPALLAVASGWLIAAVTDGTSSTAPLVAIGVVFVAGQVIGPLHEAVGYDLGDRTSTSLNDRLMAATLDAARRRPPRAGRPRRRPDDGPRLRPRHHRARRCRTA